MSNLYRDPAIDALIDKLNEEGPSELKGRYVIGDPIAIDINQMPIAFITKDTSLFQADELARGKESHFMTLAINVVYNGAKDIYKGAHVQSGTVSVWDIVEGRNADFTLKSDTIMAVLRKYTVLSGSNLYIDIQTQPVVSYGVSTPERRGIWTTEAVIQTTLRVNQLKPS